MKRKGVKKIREDIEEIVNKEDLNFDEADTVEEERCSAK